MLTYSDISANKLTLSQRVTIQTIVAGISSRPRVVCITCITEYHLNAEFRLGHEQAAGHVCSFRRQRKDSFKKTHLKRKRFAGVRQTVTRVQTHTRRYTHTCDKIACVKARTRMCSLHLWPAEGGAVYVSEGQRRCHGWCPADSQMSSAHVASWNIISISVRKFDSPDSALQQQQASNSCSPATEHNRRACLTS